MKKTANLQDLLRSEEHGTFLLFFSKTKRCFYCNGEYRINEIKINGEWQEFIEVKVSEGSNLEDAKLLGFLDDSLPRKYKNIPQNF